MADVELIETADGTPTGRHLETGATYRSIFGAGTEVRHVFLDSTGISDGAGSWNVVELGFGLGTSFCETAVAAAQLGLELHFLSVERDPAPGKFVATKRDHWGEFATEALDELVRSDRVVRSRHGVTLELHRTQWRELDAAPDRADAVYFDPFGARVNPESWRREDFEVAARVLKPTGRLATYSAAGHVRRAMAAAGLILATRPGPGRKREITVASPTDEGLGELERLSMTRYRQGNPS